MDEQNIKKAVKARYADIAKSAANTAAGGCGCGCGSGCCGPALPSNRLNDYGPLASEMEEGSDLGLGCGIPTLKAGINPGDTVLDLGSGAGADAFLAAKQTGPEGRVIGVDMTPEMISSAWHNALKGGYKNVEFRLGDLEALPVLDGTIDMVLSNCVINLVPDKEKVFSEIFRVLKSGGRFSISDMVTYGKYPEELRADLSLWTSCISGALDKDAYLDLVRRAGFKNLEIVSSAEYDHLKGDSFGILSITLQAEKP